MILRGSRCLDSGRGSVRLRPRRRRGRCGSGCGSGSSGTAVAPAAATTTTAASTLLGGRSALGIGGRLRRVRRVRRGLRFRGARGRRRIRHVDFHLPVLEARDLDQAALRRFLTEARELRHAEILLVERRVDLLHHLLQTVGAHHIAVALHPLDPFHDQLPRIVLYDFLLAGLHEPRERVVAVVLVAVHDEQIARRLADTHSDHVLAVLLELRDEAREVGVAGEEDVRADLRAGEHQLHRVDREADVGGVLLGGAVRRRHDHVDRRLGERNDVLGIASPVGVGALHGHLPLDDVAAEQVPQLVAEVGANPHRDVVEVDEERGIGRVDVGRIAVRRDREGRDCLGAAVHGSDRRTMRAWPGVACVHELPIMAGYSSAIMRSSSRRFTFPLPVIGKASRKRTRSGSL